MMQNFQVKPIGKIITSEKGTFIELESEYIKALQGLDGFSHLNIIWWFSDFDDDEFRNIMEAPQPYKTAPAIMGMFATRSPIRPNPIALTAVEVIRIDVAKGVIQTAYIDANDGSPVLDIKPYTPSFDRVGTPTVPEWCAHFPMSLEESKAFDWENEFNFQM